MLLLGLVCITKLKLKTSTAFSAKSSLRSQGSSSSDRSGNGRVPTSTASSAKSSDSYVDLEYRTSLTAVAIEQQQELRRVPSIGGTSLMDFTMNDDDFGQNCMDPTSTCLVIWIFQVLFCVA